MSDIFHEVEEDYRREQAQRIWKKYGDYIMAGAAAAIIAVAGWQLWLRYEESKAADASNAYMVAHEAAAKNDLKKALADFETLRNSAPGGYVELAELSKANTLAADGKTKEAIELYKAFAAKHNDTLADVARMRAGWLLAETASVNDLLAVIKPVSDKSGGFGPQAREIVAYAYYRAGNTDQALKGYEMVSKDANAPQGLRQRAGMMATFIKSGGAKNFGTVPPVVEQKPDPAAPVAGAATP